MIGRAATANVAITDPCDRAHDEGATMTTATLSHSEATAGCEPNARLDECRWRRPYCITGERRNPTRRKAVAEDPGAVVIS
jgi:hypothetical protein